MRVAAVVTTFLSLSVQAENAPVTVALDLTKLPEATFRELDGVGLEDRAVVRLVQEGFAVISPGKGPEVLLQLVKVRHELKLLATGRNFEDERSVQLRGRPAHELHLEVAQKGVDLVRQFVRPDPVPTAPLAHLDPPVQDEAGPPLSVAAEEQPAWMVRAGAGFLLRPGALDPMLQVEGQRWLGPWAATLTATGTRSRASQLDVTELAIQLGVAWSYRFNRYFTSELGVRGGPLWHHYGWSGSPGPAVGDRFDVLIAVPVGLELTVSEFLRFRIHAGPATTATRRTHRWNGSPLWESGHVRLEAGLSASLHL